MRRLGNILLYSTDARRIEALCDRLNERNCTVAVSETVDEVVADAFYGRPDLVVVDAGSAGAPGLAAMAAARRRPELAMVPVMVWAAAEEPDFYDACNAMAAEDAFVGDAAGAGFDEFFARLRPLMRLSTQLAEVRRRTALAARFGLAVDEPDFAVPPPACRALVVGGSAQVEARVARALPAESSVQAEADAEAALGALSGAEYDVVAVGVGDTVSAVGVLDFCRGVRNMPTLFNLPIVVLGEVSGNREEVFAAGATEVLAWPAGSGPLRYHLGACARRQHARRRIRDAIAATRATPVIDVPTGTYSPGFLRAHLDGLADEAHHWQRHLSVLIFHLSGLPADSATATGIAQVAGWIDGLVRLEDMVARWDEAAFCVVLPDTPPDETPAVIDRIVAYLGRSGVKARIGVAGFGADDDPAAMLARAEEDLKERADAD